MLIRGTQRPGRKTSAPQSCHNPFSWPNQKILPWPQLGRVAAASWYRTIEPKGRYDCPLLISGDRIIFLSNPKDVQHVRVIEQELSMW